MSNSTTVGEIMDENVNKYFAILENLKFNHENSDSLKINIQLIQNYLKIESQNIEEFATLKKISAENFGSCDLEWLYAGLLYHVLLTIKSQINFNSNSVEDLISLQSIDKYAKATVQATKYGIRHNLPTEMQSSNVFKSPHIKIGNYNDNRLLAGLNFVKEILEIDVLTTSSSVDDVYLDAMAGSLCFIDSNLEEISKNLLNCLWNRTSKIKYFRNLLILKSIKNLSNNIQENIHSNLLQKLQEPLGFSILLNSMLPQNNSDVPNWKIYEIISNIVAHKGHSNQFYDNIINQLFLFIQNNLLDDKVTTLIPCSVLCLKKLYALKKDLKIEIHKKIDIYFKNLIMPENIVAGVIVMDHDEVKSFINTLNFIFCGSPMQSLSSEILIDYLSLLINFYNQFPQHCQFKEKLIQVIVRCLANREKDELKDILTNLIFERNLHNLHPRIVLLYNNKFDTFTLQICPKELEKSFEVVPPLLDILKNSNNNILIYNSFMSILSLLEDENHPNDNQNNDLIQNESELELLVSKKFKVRFSIISFLSNLINFKAFHSQFHENSNEILILVKKSLMKRIDCASTESDDDNISLILAIFQEVIENSKDTIRFQSFTKAFKTYLKSVKNPTVKYQIENIIFAIENNGQDKITKNFEKSEYTLSRSLIEESEPYLKVYGISSMIKLINARDEEAVANKHAILALALHALKDDESYIFLNCIKLFVALINIEEVNVFDVLSDEYLNDSEKVDFRLKIGETILKITEDLGPLAYKHKDMLINCFLNGCKNSLDEFRCSSLSNLASICRLLAYQVHSFFQELLQIIESILETDKYLPAKRAAVLIISQLLWGMENLIDFQDYLLPIYRLLKSIAQNTDDTVTQIHATNGLKTLNEKCKEMFNSDRLKIEKEIKIFGINEKPVNKRHKHILELN